jgi:hypothetical protein
VFRRWLRVDGASFDQASIQVSSNGITWTTIWTNPVGGLLDTSWQEVSYDVSAIADNAMVYIRWLMGPTDGSVQYGGWNIDDIQLTGQPMVIDTDDDGIPDDWESANGLNAAVSNAANSNADGDELTDYEEYIADTHPTNGASKFPGIVLANPPPGALVLVVDPTSTARVYGVRWTTNLLDNPQLWTLYPPERIGTGSNVTFTVTNDVPGRSYRTGVRLP